MASYRPKLDVVIAEPCSESWDAMQGGTRVRHCAECARDVHNLAALTPSEIDALLAGPGPLPCMRIARFDDGSLLVADEQRTRKALGAWASAAMASLVVLSAGSASAQAHKPAETMATLSGKVVDAFGKPAANVEVDLVRSVNGRSEVVKSGTDANGEYLFHVAPGEWHLAADSGTARGGYGSPLLLRPGSQKAEHPVTLQSITVTAGVPALSSMPPQKPSDKK